MAQIQDGLTAEFSLETMVELGIRMLNNWMLGNWILNNWIPGNQCIELCVQVLKY